MGFFKQIFLFLLGFNIIAFLGCEEFLPPRDSPPEPFDVIVRTRYDYFPGSPGGPPRNQIEYTIVVKNVYDETIQDTLDLFGKLEIECQIFDLTKLTVTKTRRLDINLADIKSIKNYDRLSGITVLAPRDSIIIELNWNFIVEDTLDVLGHFPFIQRGDCDITTKQRIKSTGTIHVMKNRSNLPLKQTNFDHCFFVKTGVTACVNYVFDPCN